MSDEKISPTTISTAPKQEQHEQEQHGQESSKTETSPNSTETQTVHVFHISPLIRITLLSLYGALTVPLPFLARATDASISPQMLTVGLGVGAVILYGALSERVILNAEGIQVTYPAWAKLIWRRSWSLNWNEVKSLKPRSTGQGGLVYYFLTEAGDRAYLLPMRVAGFGALVREVQARTNIDTTDVKPLAQPWMYLILLGFTLLLLLIDAWVLMMALSGQLPIEMASLNTVSLLS